MCSVDHTSPVTTVAPQFGSRWSESCADVQTASNGMLFNGLPASPDTFARRDCGATPTQNEYEAEYLARIENTERVNVVNPQRQGRGSKLIVVQRRASLSCTHDGLSRDVAALTL